jgi:hypothetical protein
MSDEFSDLPLHWINNGNEYIAETRYEHPGMSFFLTDEYAESQIGKKMELTSTEMRFDEDFLWLSNKYCANASYDWATSDEFIGSGWQALLPSENLEKRDDLLFLNVNCDGKMVTGFEVSKTGKLVVYYDDYWFFLDPETSAASALSTRFATTYTPTSTPNFISVETEQGSYFCAVTSDQRFSLFHIDEVNHLGDGSLRLSFVTYKKDTDE